MIGARTVARRGVLQSGRGTPTGSGPLFAATPRQETTIGTSLALYLMWQVRQSALPVLDTRRNGTFVDLCGLWQVAHSTRLEDAP